MCLCLVTSIVCALNCLRSRIYSRRALKRFFQNLNKNKNFNISEAESYCPDVMLFFQIIAELDPGQFTKKLNMLDLPFITETFGFQIHHLSGNVCEKHRWVNSGFIFAGFTLILFLSGGVSYMLRVI